MSTLNNPDIKIQGITYRLQYRKCGKAKCRCATGEGHGPYWYSYDGNSAAKYVGSHLPEQVTKQVELLKRSAAKIKSIKSKISKRRDEAYKDYRFTQAELRAVQALEAGERVDVAILKQLGLFQLSAFQLSNGHKAAGSRS